MSSRTFGVELETVGKKRKDVALALKDAFKSFAGVKDRNPDDILVHDRHGSVWHVVHDGSLRGGGAEVVTPALKGKAGIEALKTAALTLSQLGASSSPGQSCGIHVHVGAKDLSPQQIANVLALWTGLERILLLLVRSDARASAAQAYPERLRKTLRTLAKRDHLPEQILQKTWYIHAGGVGNVESKYDSSRYHSLNLHSYFYVDPEKGPPPRGTLEFRLFDGTLDPHKLEFYVLLCLAVVDSGERGLFLNPLTIADFYRALPALGVSQKLFLEAFPEVVISGSYEERSRIVQKANSAKETLQRKERELEDLNAECSRLPRLIDRIEKEMQNLQPALWLGKLLKVYLEKDYVKTFLIYNQMMGTGQVTGLEGVLLKLIRQRADDTELAYAAQHSSGWNERDLPAEILKDRTLTLLTLLYTRTRLSHGDLHTDLNDALKPLFEQDQALAAQILGSREIFPRALSELFRYYRTITAMSESSWPVDIVNNLTSVLDAILKHHAGKTEMSRDILEEMIKGLEELTLERQKSLREELLQAKADLASTTDMAEKTRALSREVEETRALLVRAEKSASLAKAHFIPEDLSMISYSEHELDQHMSEMVLSANLPSSELDDLARSIRLHMEEALESTIFEPFNVFDEEDMANLWDMYVFGPETDLKSFVEKIHGVVLSHAETVRQAEEEEQGGDDDSSHESEPLVHEDELKAKAVAINEILARHNVSSAHIQDIAWEVRMRAHQTGMVVDLTHEAARGLGPNLHAQILYEILQIDPSQLGSFAEHLEEDASLYEDLPRRQTPPSPSVQGVLVSASKICAAYVLYPCGVR